VKKVYVIIINYKSEDEIQNALNSLNEKNLDLHIVILDNESTDVSYKRLKSLKDKRVELIRSENNLGFPGGVNKVFKYIQQTYDDNEYMFLFNPDAIASENLVKNILDILLMNNNAAAISPSIRTPDNVEWFTGTAIDWKHCTIQNNPKSMNTNEIRKIDVFNGCVVLLDSKKFDEVGMFDDELFLYYDEVFISMKFLNKGYEILYEPNLKVIHKVSYSISNTLKNYYIIRNHIYIFKKHKVKNSSFFCPYRIPLIKIKHHIVHFSPKNIYFILLAVWHATICKKGKL
jgi:hypothetical protein